MKNKRQICRDVCLERVMNSLSTTKAEWSAVTMMASDLAFDKAIEMVLELIEPNTRTDLVLKIKELGEDK